MAQTYPPLALLNKSPYPGREFEETKVLLQNMGADATNITPTELINFVLSGNFLSGDYNGVHADINQALMRNPQLITAMLGVSPQQLFSGQFNIQTEWRDVLLSPMIFEIWGKNKQVYKPDPEFANALIGTDKLQIVHSQIAHLPCKTFYIDLLECPSFSPVIGAFVHISEYATGVNITTYLLTKDYVYFSFYNGGGYDEKGVICIDTSAIEEREYDIYTPLYDEKGGFKATSIPYKFSRKDASIFALQLLCYLSSREPEILESPATKSTYRKPTVIKNKFSEVQQWDVGIRFGRTIRTQIEERVKREKERNVEERERYVEMGEERTRKRPAPHYRCAHWQHYWTGKGRTTCEVRWIEPVFVGFTEEDKKEARDVVIHKVL